MHSLYKQKNLPYLSKKACPNCETLIDVDKVSCPNCFFDFSLNKVNKPDIPEPANEIEPFLYCEECGEKVFLSNRFCSKCGKKLTKTICPNCHQILDVGLSFCNKCGHKVNEKEYENDTYRAIYNQSSLDEYEQNKANIENNQESKEKEEKPVFDDVINLLSMPHEEIVNIPRKRVFLIIEMFLAVVSILVALFLPILTKDTLIKTIGSLIENGYGNANEFLMDGIDYIKISFTSLANGFDFTETGEIYSKLSVGGSFLTTGAEIVSKLFSLIFNHSNASVISIYIFVGVIYVAYIGSAIFLFVMSFISMFKPTPLTDKSLLVLMTSLLLSILIIFPNTYFGVFKGYDCWAVYMFLITFIIWVFNRVFFSKEEKIYRKKYELEFKRKH